MKICKITPVKISPTKIWSVKSLPGEKHLDFFISQIILHNLVCPGENIETLIVPVNFWILPRWILILPLWYHHEDISPRYYSILGLQQRLIRIAKNSWYLPPRNTRLNFLVMIEWFLFIFIDFLWWAGNWMLSTQRFVNQNSFDEGFPWLIEKQPSGSFPWEKVLLEISQNSQENTCARVSFLIKLQASACDFIKKETRAQVFSWKFREISKNTFFTKHLRATASANPRLTRLSYVNISRYVD